MSETTNLKLFKHDNPPTNENQFDVENALNKNWDKIDESYGEIKENILTLQENDTEVKKDISDIKEEQETQNTNIENLQEKDTTQDELIEKLQQENNNIKSALINVETEQAKSLHIEDASTVSAKLEVEGNAEQETREGYNLLDMRDAKGGTSGGITVTINEDGSYKYAGTATSNTINVWLKGSFFNTTPLFTLKAGKKYYIKDVLLFNLHTQLKNANTLVQPEEDIDITGVRAVDAVTGTTYNETYYPMLTENEEKPWEQYGASPSPNFSSRVICLGSNKNLFSENYYGLFSGNQSATKEIINNKDKEIKVTTTANAYSGIFLNTTSEAMQELIEQINGKTVTYSFEAKADTNINLQIGRSSNVKIVNLNNEWQKFDITYENTNTCSIYFYNNSATVTNFYVRKIKLEEGDKATSYSINRTR